MSYDVRLQRHFNVTPDIAFHHWTDADQRRRWYQGDEDDWIVDAMTDLRVGGRYWVRWGPTIADAYQEDGTFRVVEPPHRLEYTSRFTPRTAADGEPVELLVTVNFEADGDGCLLTLVESGYPTIELRDASLRDGIIQGLNFYERTLPSEAPS